MPFAFLLAMQASGMIVDWLGTQNQQRLADMGGRLQQASIESNINQTRLEAEDASLQSLKQLRQTLGTQAAVLAARGTRSDAGSAVSLISQSVSEFNSDERMRRMNLMGRERSLKAGGALARLNAQGEKTKLWNNFSQRSFNLFPTSAEAWKQGAKNFGLTDIGS